MFYLPFTLSKSLFSRSEARLHPDFLLNSFGHAIWTVIKDTLRRQWSPFCYLFTFFYFVILTIYLTSFLCLCSCYNLISFMFTVPLTLYTRRHTHMFMHITQAQRIKRPCFSNLFYFPYALIPIYSFPLKKAETNQANSSNTKLCIKWTQVTM